MIKTSTKIVILITVVAFSALLVTSSTFGKKEKTQTGYVSIPPSAFAHMVDGSNTDTYYIGSVLFSTSSSQITLWAPVQLPDGATITSVTSYWHDSVSSNFGCSLNRYVQPGIPVAIAWISSSGDSGFGSTEDTPVDYAVVDNENCYYQVQLVFPANADYDLRLLYISIEFTIPA